MKQIIEYNEAKIVESGNSTAIELLPVIKKAIERFNTGSCTLTEQIMEDYDLSMLVSTFDLHIKFVPITAELAVVYKDIAKGFSHIVILPSTGKVYTFNDEANYTEQNICELVFTSELRSKYIRNGVYIPVWIRKASKEYKRRMRISGYRPLLYKQSPVWLQKEIAILLNN